MGFLWSCERSESYRIQQTPFLWISWKTMQTLTKLKKARLFWCPFFIHNSQQPSFFTCWVIIHNFMELSKRHLISKVTFWSFLIVLLYWFFKMVRINCSGLVTLSKHAFEGHQHLDLFQGDSRCQFHQFIFLTAILKSLTIL